MVGLGGTDAVALGFTVVGFWILNSEWKTPGGGEKNAYIAVGDRGSVLGIIDAVLEAGGMGFFGVSWGF